MSLQASTATGNTTLAPGVLSGNNIPPDTFIGQLGQSYFYKGTSPWTEYIWNGTNWAPTTDLENITTIDGDSGYVTPTMGVVTISGGTTGLTTSGSGSTLVLTGTLNVGHGGTGATTLTGVLIGNGTSAITGNAVTQHYVLVGGASNAITSVSPSTSGYVLTSNGTGSDPSFQAASSSGAITTIDGDSGSMTALAGVVTISGGTTGLTTTASSHTMDLTGTLKLANGGTNASLTASNGGIFYSTASAGAILAGTATANQMLQSGASTTPAWSTTTWPATTSINTLLYSSSASVIGQVTASDNGVLISGTTGVPSWLANGTAGYVLTAQSSAPPAWAAVPSSSVTFTGDSGTPFSGNAVTVTGGTTGLTFAASTPDLTLGGTLNVSHGGTGATSFTAYAPVCGGTTTTAALQSASTGISTSGYVLTSTGASSLPSFQAVSATGAITTIDGDSGSVTPTSGVVTISGGTTGLTTSGSSSTLDITGTLKLANGGTNASLTASNGGIFYSTASAGAILSGTATANQVLLSGSSTTPAWSTATYPATTTINQILYSSSSNVIAGITTADNGVLITSATGVPEVLANSGTAGYVLTANSGAPPSWQAAGSGGITTIDGDTGSATGSTVTFNANSNSGSSVKFTASSATVDLNVTDSNVNIAIGLAAGHTGITGSYNQGAGDSIFYYTTSGVSNTALGHAAASAVSTGSQNTALGSVTLANGSGITGSYNTAIGYYAGSQYTSSESSNILINSGGITGESNVLRIGAGTGTSAQYLKAAYICGITGSTPTSGNTPQVMLCDSSNNIAVISSSSSGYVLTSNGGATPSFQSPTGLGTLVLISSKTASSSASISFTGLTAYPIYFVTIQQAVPATNAQFMLMQMSNNNGSSWVTSGYLAGCTYFNYNGSTGTNQSNSAGWALSDVMSNSTAYLSASFYIYGANVGINPNISGTCSFYTTNACYGIVGGIGGSTGLDAIKFLMSSGNISSGIFTLYGLTA